MENDLSPAQYRDLAEFRRQIRQFLHFSEATSKAHGLEAQQHQLLLAIHGLPEDAKPTIGELASRLFIQHHSAVELVDRLEANGYVRRTRARDDRRNVIVSILPRGERLLEDVARQRIDELRSNGHELVRAIDRLLDREGKVRRVKRGGKKGR